MDPKRISDLKARVSRRAKLIYCDLEEMRRFVDEHGPISVRGPVGPTLGDCYRAVAAVFVPDGVEYQIAEAIGGPVDIFITRINPTD